MARQCFAELRRGDRRAAEELEAAAASATRRGRRPRRRALVEVVCRARRSRPAEHGRHRRPDRRSRCRRRRAAPPRRGRRAARRRACRARRPALPCRGGDRGGKLHCYSPVPLFVRLLEELSCELHLGVFCTKLGPVSHWPGDFGRRRMQRFPDRWRPREHESLPGLPESPRTATAVAARTHTPPHPHLLGR